MLLKTTDDLLVWPVHERGELVYRIELPKTHKFFRVGYREYFLLSLLDGHTTLPQACSLAAVKLGQDAPTTDEANAIAKWLLQNEIVQLSEDTASRLGSNANEQNKREGKAPAEPNTCLGFQGSRGRSPSRNMPSQSGSYFGTVTKKLNPFWMKFRLPHGERLIGSLASRLQPLMSTWASVMSIVLMAIAALLFISQRAAFLDDGIQLFHPSGWAILLVSFVGLKIVHELGHAVACERQGCRVSEFGVVFVLFAPLAYVDVSSSWRLESRASRVLISMAGMWVEMVIASIAMIVWTLTGDVTTRWIAQSVVMTAGLSTVLFNANVLMRFDGYYMLADAIDIPNLAGEASTVLRGLAKRWLFGIDEPRSQALIGWRGGFVLGYGIAAMVWRFGVCLTLGIAASTLFHGLGVVLTILGITMWWGQPALKLIAWMRGLRHSRATKFYRGLVLGSLSAVLLSAILFWVPIPTLVKTPVVTRTIASSVVRSRTDGFVDAVFVQDGQSVEAGQPLLQIRNPDLLIQHKQLQLEKQSNAIEIRKATRQHNDAEVQWRRRRAESLAEQQQQVQRRVDGLLIRAEKAGRVSGRGSRGALDQLRETYLHEGEAVVEISGSNDQEWVTLISPSHVEQARQRIGSPVTVTTPDFRKFETRVLRIEPRATDAVTEPSLAAVHGGTLATKQDRDANSKDAEQLRWTKPYFRAWLAVPEEAAGVLPTGMRLVADCGTDQRTLVARLRNWMREQLAVRR